MFMRTQRLFLRPIWPEDRAEHGATLHYGESCLWAGPAPGLPHWLITRPDDRGGAATVGQVWLDDAGDGARVTCHIVPIQRRRGFGVVALRGVAAMARTIGHRRLVAPPADVRLPGVTRTLARAGFRPAVGRGGDGIGWELPLGTREMPAPLGTAA